MNNTDTPTLLNSFSVDVNGLTIAMSVLGTTDIIGLGTSNGPVKIINIKNGETQRQLIGHSKSVNSISTVDHNDTIITGSYDQLIYYS